MSGTKYIIKLKEEQLLLVMGLLAEEEDLQGFEAEQACNEGSEGLLAVAESRLQDISNVYEAIKVCRVVNPDGKFVHMTPTRYQRLVSQM